MEAGGGALNCGGVGADVIYDFVRRVFGSYGESILTSQEQEKESNSNEKYKIHRFEQVSSSSSAEAAEFLERVRAIVSEFPDLLESHERDRFPVHRLCRYLHEAEDRAVLIRPIRLLMELDSSCLLVRDGYGCVALFCMIDGFSNHFLNDPLCFDLFRDMIIAQPSTLMIQNNAGDTPLHQSCCGVGKDTLATVQILLATDRRAASVRNNDGRLPLHLASFYQQAEIVRLLIDAFPSDITTQDHEGSIPLHYACWCNEPNMDIIQLLIQTDPASVAYKNYVGETPLHFAAQERASLHVIESLIQTDRSILVKQDYDGTFPFHYICDVYPLHDLITLMRLHLPYLPDLIHVKDRRGHVPGQQRGPWFPKFSQRASCLLETESALHNDLDWMKDVSDALVTSLTPENTPIVGRILLDWIQNRRNQHIQELDMVDSELEALCVMYSS
jgi:ankyrin repeat protein